MPNPPNGVQSFPGHEAAGGVVLLLAAIGALIMANSGLAGLHGQLLDVPVAIHLGALHFDKPLLFWINDGLMAVFFFLVGLEIKRELLVGALSSPARASLPAIAALGGMIVPAIVYLAITHADPGAQPGWGVPVATDIAFAMGVLAIFGERVPPSLKVFLLALAIIDDLGAILIIAIFYTADLSLPALSLAALAGLCLFALNRGGGTRLLPYLLIGLVMWVCVLESGVHATLAGVATALAVPLTGSRSPHANLVERTEHALGPWVTFGVLPLFAFANAGVSLAAAGSALTLIPSGIALGLILGKPIGIMAASRLAIGSGLSELPEGASWVHMLGVAMLGGIGFTMSLFIGMLAFPSPAHAAELRIGVLMGSVVAAVTGSIILGLTLPRAGNAESS